MRERAKKTDPKQIVIAIVITGAIYPLAWLLGQIGNIGFTRAISAISDIGFVLIITWIGGLGGCAWFWITGEKKETVDSVFEADALAVLRNSQLNRKYSSQKYCVISLRHAMVFRFIQIFSDSVSLVRRSKNRTTVESRMRLADEMYQEIDKYRNLLSQKLAGRIDLMYQTAVEDSAAKLDQLSCSQAPPGNSPPRGSASFENQ